MDTVPAREHHLPVLGETPAEEPGVIGLIDETSVAKKGDKTPGIQRQCRAAQVYFDRCLREALQLHRAFRYTKLQPVRAGIVRDYRDYPHTRVHISVEEALERARLRNAYLAEVPYQRYERARGR